MMWCIQPLGSFGHYDLREPHKKGMGIGTSEASCRMFLVVCITVLSHAAFFMLAALSTTLNQELGFVTFGVVWIVWIIASYLAAPVAAIIGQKYALVFAPFCMCIFFISNYYPTWYTLIPGAVFIGIGGGFYWVLIFPYMATTAEERAAQTGDTAAHYANRYFGIYYLAYGMAAVFGNLTSSAFLLPDQLATANHSFASGGNETCSDGTQVISPASWAVYCLLSVTAGLGILSFLLACALPKTARDKLVTQNSLLTSVRLFRKSLTQLSLLLVIPMMAYGGFSFGAYFGLFSKHFISECVGVGVVGFAVVTWGISVSFSSVVLVRVAVYTSCTVLAVLTTAIEGGFLVFLLCWEREPSLVVVFLISLLWGFADGFWLTFTTGFLSATTSSELRSASFGIHMGFYCIGGTLSYFLAAYIPVFFHLLIFLILVLVGAILYITGVLIYRKDTFHCKKTSKKGAAPDTQLQITVTNTKIEDKGI